MSYRSIPVQRGSVFSSPNNTLHPPSQAHHFPHYHHHHPVHDDQHYLNHPSHSRTSQSVDRQLFSSISGSGIYPSAPDRGQIPETWRSGNYGTLPINSSTSSRSDTCSFTKRPFESAFRTAIERMRLSSESRLEGIGQDTHYPGCNNTDVFPPGILPSSTSTSTTNYYRKDLRVSPYNQDPILHSQSSSRKHPFEVKAECESPPPPVHRETRHYENAGGSRGTVLIKQFNRDNSTSRWSSFDTPMKVSRTTNGTQTEPSTWMETASDKGVDKRSMKQQLETMRDFSSQSNFISKCYSQSNTFPDQYRNVSQRDYRHYVKEDEVNDQYAAAPNPPPPSYRDTEFDNSIYSKITSQPQATSHRTPTENLLMTREESKPAHTLYSASPPPPPVRRVSHAKFSPRPQSVTERISTQRPAVSHQFADKLRSNIVSSQANTNGRELKEFNPETEKEEKLELPSVKEIIQQVEAISKEPSAGKSIPDDGYGRFSKRMTQSYYDDPMPLHSVRSKPCETVPTLLQTKSSSIRKNEILGRRSGETQLSGDYQKLLDAFMEQKNEIERLRREVFSKDSLIGELQENLRLCQPWQS